MVRLVRALRPSFATLAAALLLGLPGQAHAQESGAAGRLVKIIIHGAGDEAHASSHGSITVRHSGNKLDQYSWGGTRCPATDMGETEIAALQTALHFRSRTLIVPRFRTGEASGARCLVGFELQAG